MARGKKGGGRLAWGKREGIDTGVKGKALARSEEIIARTHLLNGAWRSCKCIHSLRNINVLEFLFFNSFEHGLHVCSLFEYDIEFILALP